MSKKLQVWRNEYKYWISHFDSILLKEDLSKLLQRDSFSANGEYCVRSLYFDSINNIDYMQKLAGTQIRKKIRLRCYGLNDERVKLEIKQKNGKYQKKSSLLISREEAIRLQNLDYGVLLEYEDEVALEIYSLLQLGCYRPVSLIEYNRMAYTYSEFNTRITVDSNIYCSNIELDLFNAKKRDVPVINEQAVLEVKFNNILLTSISNVLSKYDLVNTSVSKYALSRGAELL